MKTARNNLLYVLLLTLTAICPLFAKAAEPALTAATHTALTKARDLIKNEQYASAKNIIDELLQSGIPDYDRAITQQIEGYIYIGLKNNSAAIKSFTSAIDLGVLPEQVSHQVEFILARLLASESDYKKAEMHLEHWLKSEPKPNADAHVLAASIYYQTGKMQPMVDHLQELLKINENQDKTVFDMLLYGYFQLKDYNSAAQLLVKLLSKNPGNKEYWKQLAATYLQLKQYKKAIAYYKLAYLHGYLDTTDIMQLVSLYMSQQLPYEAASLLNDEIDKGTIEKNKKNLELLAHCWLQAREYDHATDTMQQIVDINQDPDIYYQMGRIFYQQQKWPEVIKSMQRAMKHPDPGKKSFAALLTGIAEFHIENYADAAKALNQAKNYHDTRSQAQWWLDKIDRTLKKNNS